MYLGALHNPVININISTSRFLFLVFNYFSCFYLFIVDIVNTRRMVDGLIYLSFPTEGNLGLFAEAAKC